MPIIKRIAGHELAVAVVILAIILSLAFFDVVFKGKSMLSPVTSGGVMGLGVPYGYTGDNGVRDGIPIDDFRLDPGASAWQMEPLTLKARSLLLGFHSPLWNANSGTGAPLAADMQSTAFDPLKLPLLISTAPFMWDVYLLGRFLLGGLFALLFGRVMRLSLPACLAVAIGYILSGHFLLYSNQHWLDVYFSLPLVLLGIELTLKEARPRDVAILAAAVALNFLGGMPEASFTTLVMAACFAAYRLVTGALQRRGDGTTTRAAIGIGIGFGAGVALAAPLLLPFAEYTSNAFTTHTTGSHGLSHDPLRFAVSLLVPYYRGRPLDPVPGLGESGILNYVGVVMLFLAVLGVGNRPLASRTGWFFLAVALIIFAKTYGLAGINYLGRLPLADLVLFPRYAGPCLAFSLAFLAGAGVDRLSRGEGPGWKPHVAASVLFVLLLIVILGTHFTNGLPQSSGLWLEIALAFVGLTWLVLYLGVKAPSRTAWACLALLAGELLLLAPHGIYRPRYDNFTKPPYVDVLQTLQAKEGRGRLFAFDVLLFPNDASAFGLDDVRMLNALYPDRYFEYVRQFVSPTVSERFVGAPLTSLEDYARVENNAMFDLLGVRYVLARRPGIYTSIANPIIDDIVRRFGSTANLRKDAFTINGEEKAVLFAQAPADVTFDLTVTPQQSVLRFSVALKREAWDASSDGVDFSVVVDAPGSPGTTLWSQFVDPRNTATDRRWFDVSLDLSAYTGAKLTVHLVTSPHGNIEGDAAGWGAPKLASPSDPPSKSQFALIYDGDVRVYRNLSAFPRAFAMHRVAEVKDGPTALAVMRHPSFDPSQLAVIEGKLPDAVRSEITASPQPDRSVVSIQRYSDNRVDLQAEMEHTGLVVLSDTIYPGWKAFVDGRRTQIYTTDYAFRGVLVPAGNHQVTFVYDPASFKLGLVLAVAAVLGLAGWWLNDKRQRRRGLAQAIPDASGQVPTS